VQPVSVRIWGHDKSGDFVGLMITDKCYLLSRNRYTNETVQELIMVSDGPMAQLHQPVPLHRMVRIQHGSKMSKKTSS